MMQRFFGGDFVRGRGAIGLLALRVFFGSGLIAHGFSKIQNPFGWMPAKAGIPPFLQFLAAVSEFFGGLALVVGLLTPLAALGVIATMSVAVLTVHLRDPLFSAGGGASKEPALSYLFPALTLLFAGAGTLSLDYLLFGRKKDTAPANVSPAY